MTKMVYVDQDFHHAFIHINGFFLLLCRFNIASDLLSVHFMWSILSFQLCVGCVARAIKCIIFGFSGNYFCCRRLSSPFGWPLLSHSKNETRSERFSRREYMYVFIYWINAFSYNVWRRKKIRDAFYLIRLPLCVALAA